MIPRLSQKSARKDGRGKSFRDLSSYLFTGERHQMDLERVAWSETINCHASDHSQVWAEMAWTWEHADDLKRANYHLSVASGEPILDGKSTGGRKNENPVWHLSLNWRAGESPSREEMMEAARSVLKRFGLEDHQTLIVAHKGDTEHDHIHLMVNTVNPYTGKTQDVSRSGMYRLSSWALDYEKERGEIQCEQRQENWQQRAKNKEMHKLWTHFAEAKPELGAPKLNKTYGKSDSRPLWQLKKQAKDAGYTPDQIEKLSDLFKGAWDKHFKNERDRAEERKKLVKDAPEAILASVMKHHATFTRQDMAKAVMATAKAQNFQEVFDKVMALPEVKKINSDTSLERYSTEKQINIEAEMAKAATKMIVSQTHGISGRKSVKDVSEGLSPQQVAALERVTRADQLSCVVGYAGTGKSMMLGAARQLWEASGYTVHGTALAGIAAEGLEAGSGIRSRTIKSLQNAIDSGSLKLTNKDVIVMDEAGMVASHQMHGIITAAEKAGAKVVLTGDPMQLQAIEAGAAFRAIVDAAGAAHITEVRRQHAEWQRNATVQLATGYTEDALRAYDKAGALRAHEDKADARSGMIQQWAEGLHDPKSQIMLAATNIEVGKLNGMARTAMREAGLLAGEDTQITAREESMDKPARDFQMQIAKGERILFTKNDKALGVKRGTLGTLAGMRGDSLFIQIDGKRHLTEVKLSTYRNIAPGYALTIHKAQGVTVDRAFVLAGKTMDAHMAYVALSRHRDSVQLHYSYRDDAQNLEGLALRLGRQNIKDTTLDYVKPYKAPYQLRDERAERELLAGTLSKLVSTDRSRMSEQFRHAQQFMRKQRPSNDRGRER